VGLLETRFIFLFSGYEGLILLVIFTCHFLQAKFSQDSLLSFTSLLLPGTNFMRSSFFLADWKVRFPVLSKVKDKDLTPKPYLRSFQILDSKSKGHVEVLEI
jgi:hypothetical protein